MSRKTLLVLALMALLSCSDDNGDGPGAGMKRALRGTLQQACLNCLRPTQEVALPQRADTVMVTDTSGQSSQHPVDNNGDFTAPLERNRSYVISFLDSSQDIFVASLVFQTSQGQDARTIPPGERDIDLGLCSLSEGRVTPTNNPLEQTDADQDGTSDFRDSDYGPSPISGLGGNYLWQEPGTTMTVEFVDLGDGYNFLVFLQPDLNLCTSVVYMYGEGAGSWFSGLGYTEAQDPLSGCVWAQVFYLEAFLDEQGNLSGQYWMWMSFNYAWCDPGYTMGTAPFTAQRQGDVQICTGY